MNSHWTENLIIFAMTLVSTRSNGQIKIRVFGARKSKLRVNLVKVAKIFRNARVWFKTMNSVVLQGFWPSVNPRLTRGILVILAKKVLWVLQRPNGLRHIILDVLMAPWRENNIFGYFGIRHANREQTKYSINSILYIIIIVFIFIFIFY